MVEIKQKHFCNYFGVWCRVFHICTQIEYLTWLVNGSANIYLVSQIEYTNGSATCVMPLSRPQAVSTNQIKSYMFSGNSVFLYPDQINHNHMHSIQLFFFRDLFWNQIAGRVSQHFMRQPAQMLDFIAVHTYLNNIHVGLLLLLYMKYGERNLIAAIFNLLWCHRWRHSPALPTVNICVCVCTMCRAGARIICALGKANYLHTPSNVFLELQSILKEFCYFIIFSFYYV